MERKKRVSVGVVLMGFFLIFVMLGGVAALSGMKSFFGRNRIWAVICLES